MDIVAAILVVFLAGVLRGMTGFGFALVAAMGLAAFWPPATTTPMVLLVELAVTLLMLRDGGLGAMEPRRVVPLSLGGVAGTFVGTFAASRLPSEWVRPALDAAVLACALVSLVHVRAPRLDHPAVASAIGLVVGTLASAFAVGGPFVVVWFLAIGAAPAAIRGNLVVFFGLVDLAAVLVRLATIGLPRSAVELALLLVLPSLAGVHLGGRLFRRIDAAWWRRIAAWSIAAGAVASLARSFLSR